MSRRWSATPRPTRSCPGCTGCSRTRSAGPWASTTACARSTSRPTWTSSCSGSTAAARLRRRSPASSASRSRSDHIPTTPSSRWAQRDKPFLENGLTWPRLVRHGPQAGQIVWARPAYQMIQKMLTNPAYAGASVYGRVKREVEPGEPPPSIERRPPPAAWDIVVRDVYPAYLSFDAYLANRRQLRGNLAGFERESRGAARNGAALLHGLVVCGRCGSRMGVSYGRGDRHRRYECRRAQAEYAAPVCQSFLAREIDRTVAEAFLEAVRPAGLEATIAALHGLEAERRSVDRQWQLRLERARYEARLAQRQYDAVDPDNRLVARELERRWEAALAEAGRVEQEYASRQRSAPSPLSGDEVEQVRRLAADLPALWHADTTTPVDRKRLCGWPSPR